MKIRPVLTYCSLFVILSCNQEKKETLSFKSCTIDYSVFKSGEKELYTGHYVTNEILLESAKRELALCLCEKYLQDNNDSEIKEKIIELFRTNRHPLIRTDTLPFDSILFYREEIFDPRILVD